MFLWIPVDVSKVTIIIAQQFAMNKKIIKIHNSSMVVHKA